MPVRDNPQVPDSTPRTRLDDFIKANRIVRFFEDIPDKEFPFVTCSVFGAPRTNELFVKLTNGRVSFVDSVLSRLISPPMQDRIFGMDALDQEDAFKLADKMWERFRGELLAH